MVGDPARLGKHPIGRMAVGHQHDIGVEHRRQATLQMGVPQRRPAGDEVDRSAAAVTRHQDAVVLMRDAAASGRAAAPARRSVQLARTFLRLEQVSLVRFRDAQQRLNAIVLGLHQEPVAPAKTGVLMNARECRGAAHRVRLQHAFQVGQPFAALAQSRQRRARQRIAAAGAVDTPIALQSVRLTVTMQARGTAVRTRFAPGRLDQRASLFAQRSTVQASVQVGTLTQRQRGGLLDELPECARIHQGLPTRYGQVQT